MRTMRAPPRTRRTAKMKMMMILGVAQVAAVERKALAVVVPGVQRAAVVIVQRALAVVQRALAAEVVQRALPVVVVQKALAAAVPGALAEVVQKLLGAELQN